MIAIRSNSGELLKTLSHSQKDSIWYHNQIGFCNPEVALSRLRMRKNSGLQVDASDVEFSFKIQDKELTDAFNCKIAKVSDNLWKISALHNIFDLSFVDAEVAANPKLFQPIEPQKEKNWIARSAVLLLLLAAIALAPQMGQKTEVVEEVKQVEAPVVVQMKQVPKVVVPETKPIEQQQVKQTNQALDKTAKVQKALTQNLGFLKMLGRKDLTKAVGGLPNPNLKEASAGAGPGGLEGSGGQMLTGLGQGLRKTTVGNSGVAGLGGIGTKGKGGGLGGYGETDYASGAGRSLSTIPLAQDAVIEGGLDKSLIQATIMRYLSQVRACYEEGLKRKADMIGQVTMDFEINGQGGLNFARVMRSSLGDKEVESCISTRMMNWKFPTPRGGVNVKVNYPFMLRPTKS